MVPASFLPVMLNLWINYLILQHGTLDTAELDDDDYDSETVTFHDALSSGEEDPEILLEDLEYD